HEADQVIRKLPEESLALGDLPRLAAQVSLRVASTPLEYGAALERARQAVAPDSKDYRDHVWLGQVLWAAGRRDAAEAALRRAARMAEKRPEPWVALVQCLAQLDPKDRAEAVLREAEGKLPRDQAALALAHCYQAVGRDDRAERLYRDAVAARPDDPATLGNLANFYWLRGKAKQAEPHLNKLIDMRARAPEEAAWARRALALALTATDNYQQARAALTLLGVLDEAGHEVPARGL